jgi:hydroxymethylglutaryl-CoA lyase
MSDIPKRIQITEEGPREGFQIEPGPITTARKLELIHALTRTGLKRMQITSFVNPKKVPGMADAEAVVAGLQPEPGVDYHGLWLNEKGLQRAMASGKLHLEGKVNMYPSETFLMKNQGCTPRQYRDIAGRLIAMYKSYGIPMDKGSISSAWGCNFEGGVSAARVVELIGDLIELAAEHDIEIKTVSLADTMAWATPLAVKRTVGAVREKFPDLRVSLHLHDTRGMAIANAYAGMEMGVDLFDASVAGLGGCPFGKHKGAAGNVCTEDLVLMCDEIGVETGVDLEALIDAAQLAEDIVGHPLPGSVMKGGSLRALRAKLQAPAA